MQKHRADGEEIAALNNAPPANTQINTRLNQQKNHTPQRALFFSVFVYMYQSMWNILPWQRAGTNTVHHH
jgi:hypothetical protein